MTTIVCFNGFVAADRFANWDPGFFVDKLVKTPVGVLGHSGRASEFPDLMDWVNLEAGAIGNGDGLLMLDCVNFAGKPFLVHGDAVLMTKDGRVFLLHRKAKRWLEVDKAHPFAIGSGAPYAVGAAEVLEQLDHDADYIVEQAVRVAAKYDSATKLDGGVQIIEASEC